MPGFTIGGVQYPLSTDIPRRQDLEDLARSIDVPQGLETPGKLRYLESGAPQNFPNTTSLASVTTWVPGSGSRADSDQGDACGIILSGGQFLTVSEQGFYWIYANYEWGSSDTGMRRVAIHNATTNALIQTRGQAAGTTSSTFHGCDVSAMVWLDSGTQIDVQAAQSSGNALDGGTTASRTAFQVAKVRLQ